MKIVYVLPVKGGGGGAHSVAQEVNELINMGISVKIAINSSNVSSFITTYADMPNIGKSIVEFHTPEHLSKHLRNCDIVVCTIFTSVKLVKQALQHITHSIPKVTYYVQDYEPLFSNPESALWHEAYKSYELITNATLFAKTNWLQNIVKCNHNLDVKKVSPSIDHEVYYPNLSKNSSQIWISAMVRPGTPRRAPYRTMHILKNLHELYGSKVNLNIFGCSPLDLLAANLSTDFAFHNHGVLSRREVASLLRQSHMFLDLSDYQAFGRTGLESMACGCVPLLPSIGGTDEYAINGINACVVDTRNEDAILQSISHYIEADNKIREQMMFDAIKTSQNFSIRKSAISEYLLFKSLIKDQT